MSTGFYAMPRFDYPNVLTEMVYCYLCKRARWQKEPIRENGIEIKQSQVIASIRGLSKVFEVHRNTMTSTLNFLATERLLTIERLDGDSKSRSIITICNDFFIKDSCTTEWPPSVPGTVPPSVPGTVPPSVPPTHDLPNDNGGLQAPNTLTQEHLEHVNTEPPKKRKGSRSSPPSEHDILLGTRWAEWANSEHPKLKAKPEAYALAIKKTKKSKQLGEKEIDFIFDFIINDSFWSQNCQSPAGLLKESKNGVRKIDNILAKMKHKHRDDIFIAQLQNSDGEPQPKTEYLF